MAIAVVGMLDEREQGLGIIKEEIEKRGQKAILIDISMGTGAIKYTLKPDISVIKDCGISMKQIIITTSCLKLTKTTAKRSIILAVFRSDWAMSTEVSVH